MSLQDFPKTPRTPVDEASFVLEQSGGNPQLALLLQLAVFAAVGTLLMLLTPEAPWSIKLLIIALVFLTLKRWGGVVVLLLVQADLYSRESQRISALSGFWGVVFVLMVLIVLMFVARHRLLLLQTANGSLFRVAKDVLLSSELPQSTADSTPSAPVAPQMFAAAFRGVILLLGCVMTARILLEVIPENRGLTENLRDVINSDPTITMGAMLIVGIVTFWVVASEISWRQMTPAQARVYLRSNFLRIHYQDLRMIVMRRLKLRMKRIAAKKGIRKDTST